MKPILQTLPRRLSRSIALVALLTSMGLEARADSPTDAFKTPNTSLLKGTNWSTGSVPLQGVTGTISGVAQSNPLGWNYNTVSSGSTPGTLGDLDFTSGETNLVVGNYTTSTSGPDGLVNITLTGSTLNSQANTVLANSTGSTVVFENDVAPTGDDLAASGLTTFTLGNTTNVIQVSASSNIIIDNVITGTGDSLTFLGGGKSGTTGGTLELGAGSANDVVGGVAANAPVKANGGALTSTAVVQTADKNSFTGGLVIGDVGGAANAGVVQADGSNDLPTTGTITVNTNSQLRLNGSSTYGASTQSLVLNGTGTATTGGALTTAAGNTSTLQNAVTVASTSSINVQSSGLLTMSGTISGTGQLQSTGSGILILTGANSNSGGVTISAGTTYANSSSSSTGTGTVNVAANATLGGSGVIDPLTSGAGVVLGSGSKLISGGVQAAPSSSTKAGTGLTLNNTTAAGTILNASLGANITFSLGAGTTPGTGVYNFSDPNLNSTYMTVLGNTAGELKFSAADTVTVNDLSNGNLQLAGAIPYLLISTTAGNNSDFSGLVTSGGVDPTGVAQNGVVTNLVLTGGNLNTYYPPAELYLYNGDLEIVPEPGTWILLTMGMVALVAIRRHRTRNS